MQQWQKAADRPIQPPHGALVGSSVRSVPGTERCWVVLVSRPASIRFQCAPRQEAGVSTRFHYDHIYEAGVWTSDTYDFNT